jgi:hypothetical protein
VIAADKDLVVADGEVESIDIAVAQDSVEISRGEESAGFVA